jgi:hypothetical protein
MRITCAASFATMSATTTRNVFTLYFEILRVVVPLKLGRHRKQRSLDYRELEAFTTGTPGRRRRRHQNRLNSVPVSGGGRVLMTDRELVAIIGGFIAKHAVAIYGVEPASDQGFRHESVDTESLALPRRATPSRRSYST